MRKTVHLMIERLYRIASTAILTIFLLNTISCKKEKDQINNPSKENFHSTVEYFVDGGDYWDISEGDMENFLESMLDSTWEDTIPYNQAMYLSETFANLNICSSDNFDNILEMQDINFQMEIEVLIYDGDTLVTPYNLRNLNDRIYQKCDSVVDTLQFQSSGDGGLVYISIIDIDWETHISEANILTMGISFVVKKEKPLLLECAYEGSYMAIKNSGCQGNSSNVGAMSRMETFLNNSLCNTDYGCKSFTGDPYGIVYYYQVEIKEFKGHPSGSTLWYGGEFDCLTTSQLYKYSNNSINLSNTYKPFINGSSSVYKDILEYKIGNYYYGGSCVLCYGHVLKIYFGRCSAVNGDMLINPIIKYDN